VQAKPDSLFVARAGRSRLGLESLLSTTTHIQRRR